MSKHGVTGFYKSYLNTIFVQVLITSGYNPIGKSVMALSNSRVEIVALVLSAKVVVGGGLGI